MKMNEKKCPFCGSKMINYDIVEGGIGLVEWIECPECGFEGAPGYKFGDPWNEDEN